MKEKSRRIILIFFIIGISILTNLIVMESYSYAGVEPSVSYSTHVQNVRWQNYVKDGQTAGTTHQSLRLEGIKIKIENNPYGGDIEYATHVQNIGWQNFVKNDAMAGTTGRSLRLEAIKIRLTGNIANYYDIYYRVHAQNFGWLDWAKNGEEAGSAGYSYRLEAIEIKLVRKGTNAPGATKSPFKQAPTRAVYNAHVQYIGWQGKREQAQTAGTMHKSYRMEAIQINLESNYLGGSIQYRTHVENIGWQSWKKNGETAGTTGKEQRLEAIEIKLNGNLQKEYDVEYRAYIQNIGWQSWKKNGEMAGTTGQKLRLEAIEIKLTKKNNTETTGKVLHGIDVANQQGVIDWQAVKKDGIDFAMIRVGFRGYGVSSDGIDGKIVKDDSFEYNITNALKANIPVGIYFFSQAKTEQEAIEEAEFTINCIKNYKITYPVAIDVEYGNSNHTGRADKLSREERTKVVQAFCEKMKKAGYKPMLYTGKNFALNNLDMGKLSNYDLWLAHYTGATQENPLEKPSNYTGNYTMWQYTDTGTASGINGSVDRDICYKVY